MKTKPRLYTNALSLLLLANVLAYTTVHLCYLFMMESFGIYLELARTYIVKAWEIAMYPMSCAVLLVGFAHSGRRNAVGGAALISLCRLGYSLPYYYMYFLGLGFDSGEAILIDLGISALMYLLNFGVLVLCLYLSTVLAKRSEGSYPFGTSRFLRDALLGRVADHRSIVGRIILPSVVVGIVSELLSEIYDTITFFIDYISSFSISEVLLICFNYLFIVAVGIGVYYLSCLISLRIGKRICDQEL